MCLHINLTVPVCGLADTVKLQAGNNRTNTAGADRRTATVFCRAFMSWSQLHAVRGVKISASSVP